MRHHSANRGRVRTVSAIVITGFLVVASVAALATTARAAARSTTTRLSGFPGLPTLPNLPQLGRAHTLPKLAAIPGLSTALHAYTRAPTTPPPQQPSFSRVRTRPAHKVTRSEARAGVRA